MQTIDAGRAVLRDKPLRRALLIAAMFLVAIGLLAVGVSGLLAAGSRAAWDDRFVAGNGPDVRYSAARCADLFEYEPDARTCVDAAASHHADEVVQYRIVAGLLGALLLGAWALTRRRGAGAPLPPTLVPAIGATAFGGAAAALAVEGTDALVRSGSDGGAGQWLSGAIVAGIVALAFARRLIIELAASTSA